MKYCLKCGAELKDEAKFCDECGAKQETQVIENAEPNELVEENKNGVIEITELPEAEKSTLSNKAKRKHKLAIIICIIAVLVVIAGVITTICIVNNNRNSNEEMQSSQKYEKNSSDTNTSEYKLDSEYTLDDITFSINKDWSFNESDDNHYWYAEDNSFLYAKKNPIESSVTDADFYLDQLAKGIVSSADEVLKTEKIKIDGTDAIKVDCVTNNVQATLCMFILNNNTYCLGGTTDNDTIMFNYFDEVINSIKINETTTTKKDNTNTVVYKDKTVKITYKGTDEDDIFGTELNFTIENLSKKNITVQARDVSINGIMVDPIFSCNVSARKIANDDMSFSNLEDDGIDKIKTVELSFHIFDDDSWDTIVDTKVVKIRVS